MTTNIYVGNLTFDTDSAQLESLFSQHGQVTKAQVVMDRDTGRSRGFGFVEMPNKSEAETAITQLNGKDVGGRALRINEARPREQRR